MTASAQRTSRILAIETSCDETAAAVVENGRHILSNVIASQRELHAEYGGVFPEVASRKHIEVIHPVINQALQEAHLSFEDIDCIAVTKGPGLVGSLLVGVNAAKGISLGSHKPMLGINHIEGHLYSLWLLEEFEEIPFPILALVVSGGHSELYLMREHLSYEHLGGTLDDAAGEAFDKVGRLLGLPFPGGPAIDKASMDGDPAAFRFPRAVLDDTYNFSFSGLKTAVMRATKGYDEGRLPVADFAASFQAAVIDVLATKTERAAGEFDVSAVHVSGGVSANQLLRKELQERISVPVRFPPHILCTDNAAMIAAAAHQHFLVGHRDNFDLDVVPNLQL